MASLGNQPPRKPHNVRHKELSDFLHFAAEIAKDHSISVEAVISAKHALEMERSNDIAVDSGDASDENLAGIGEKLTQIAEATEMQSA